MFDAIVIGAGPAGLQAALTLGRMHRPTLLLDSGEYRNGTVQHMHNVIAADGTPPADFRATARAQLDAYAEVTVREIGATTVAPDAGAFSVALTDGTSERARRVILATGVADDLPDVPGLDDLWGLHAFACPFCDGHEYSGRHIGILGAGARAEHLIGMLGRIAESITVFPLSAEATDEERAAVEARGAHMHASPVESVAREGSGVRVRAGGETADLAGLFVAAGTMRQRAPFAEQLGLAMLPSGCIEIDDFGRTSAPGILAAGDLAHRASLPGPLASVIMAAGAGQFAAAAIVQELSAADSAAALTTADA